MGEVALGQHIAGERSVSVCDGACDAVKFQQAGRISSHSCVADLRLWFPSSGVQSSRVESQRILKWTPGGRYAAGCPRLDTTGSPRFQPVCDFCKWMTGTGYARLAPSDGGARSILQTLNNIHVVALYLVFAI